jgi:hypothetical protein
MALAGSESHHSLFTMHFFPYSLFVTPYSLLNA